MSIAYVVTAFGMVCIPGPDVLLLTGRALQRGGGPALRTLCGTVAGYLVITLVVAAGLGSVLAGREWLLAALHGGAVGYLLWLAFGAWRTAGREAGPAAERVRGDWRDGFVTAALNPKALLFFLALMPPFLDPAAPAGPQLLWMGLTFTALIVLVYLAYVSVTVAARRKLRLTGRTMARTSAAALVAAAAVVAATAVT
jgi:threonine/homoserine/homoserine lactone efflux protein